MLVVIIAKYRLRQELFQYCTMYDCIIFAIFFFVCFAVLHALLAKFWSQPHEHTSYSERTKNSANVEASPQGYLIITS